MITPPQETNHILTRAEFMAAAGEAFARALRMAKPMSVMLLDIDYFRTVNDTWGRIVGDEVVEGMNEICNQRMRKRDLIGRFGGDVWGFVLLDTALEGAQVVAERLRIAITTRAFILHGPNGEVEGPLHVTASIGLVDLTSGGSSLPGLIEHARQALVRAKENGRNRVELYS